ncbi:DUF4872 domain-containing protein [Cytobacillus sp. Hm23]
MDNKEPDKYQEINFNKCMQITSSAICSTIRETCINMLNPSTKIYGLNSITSGLKGINKFSKEIMKEDKFDEKLEILGMPNYLMINEAGGTGGSIFRKVYGNFLIQANEIVNSKEMNL